jgi:hypothetical protein
MHPAKEKIKNDLRQSFFSNFSVCLFFLAGKVELNLVGGKGRWGRGRENQIAADMGKSQFNCLFPPMVVAEAQLERKL